MTDREAPAARRGLFVITILTGSFLLFLVQPLVARLALPLLGGAPGVWNSAMLTFQVLLLGGYAYAHALSGLTLRRQAAVHLVLLLAAALILPVSLAELPRPAPGWEVLWVPALFLATIGPVFLLLSAQASLMQRWYAAAPGAGNPYRLYAASNIGSFAGLLAYPFVVEPALSTSAQSGAWAWGYGVLIVCVLGAALHLTVKGENTHHMIEACFKAFGKRPTEYQVALDGLSVYVHETNPIKQLSLEQLQSIFTGRVRNWKEVGGPDLARL